MRNVFIDNLVNFKYIINMDMTCFYFDFSATYTYEQKVYILNNRIPNYFFKILLIKGKKES